MSCSSGQPPGEPAIGAARQALSAAQATVTVSVSGETGLQQVALGATESMRVAPWVHVTSVNGSRASVSNTGPGRTELNADSTIDGAVVSVGEVALYDRAHVRGSLFTAAAIVPQPSNGIVGGAIAEHMILNPPSVYTWTVDLPASSLALTLNSGETQPPPSGGAYTKRDPEQRGHPEFGRHVFL